MNASVVIPSSGKLLDMISDAERRFEHDREQALLKREARLNERAARAWAAETKAKYYARLVFGK